MTENNLSEALSAMRDPWNKTLTFGACKGRTLRQVDPGYLDWLSQNDWTREKYGFQVVKRSNGQFSVRLYDEPDWLADLRADRPDSCDATAWRMACREVQDNYEPDGEDGPTGFPWIDAECQDTPDCVADECADAEIQEAFTEALGTIAGYWMPTGDGPIGMRIIAWYGGYELHGTEVTQ